MKYRSVIILVCSASLMLAGMKSSPQIYLIGDSTMADKELIGNPERGWGQLFSMAFADPTVVQNHARNGRSTKSFIDEGRWQKVVQQLQQGDYVMIQFGHNDAKKEDLSRYAEARTDYRANLIKFITDSRTKEAIPILITPVCRRRFDSNGRFYDVHGEYPAVVREIGKEFSVPVIDLHKRSYELFEQLGVEKTKSLFLLLDSGKYSAVPKGKEDNTHFSSIGAAEVARLVSEEIHRLSIPLGGMMRKDGPKELVGAGKLVMLDCFYNNEWKQDSKGRRYRYHYVWDDTANSGFSMLGTIISQTGAVIDTLCQAPTQRTLQRADIYIIVDPDTKQETEFPNFIDENAANAITEWVKAGGVLVLLGNDKGKAEFEHFNRLAQRFGIRFNEDSRNPATATEFAGATFNRFPDHPLFKDVRRVFIKEISTLNIQEPARAILADNNDVIMAFAKVGKGAVFAVGDPWFYNEYMGTWRLPDGYDNPRAAENLFRWLLAGAF